MSSETNSDTKCPSGPWPSNTPKILKSLILFTFVLQTKESWFVFVFPEESFPGWVTPP